LQKLNCENHNGIQFLLFRNLVTPVAPNPGLKSASTYGVGSITAIQNVAVTQNRSRFLKTHFKLLFSWLRKKLLTAPSRAFVTRVILYLLSKVINICPGEKSSDQTGTIPNLFMDLYFASHKATVPVRKLAQLQ